MNCPSIILTHGHLPGKVGTKFMATPGMEGGQPSISGMFAGALGLHRWRGLVLRISKEKNRVQSVRSPQRSWRFLGMNLRACKKKRGQANLTLCHLASSTSVQTPWPGSPPEKGFPQAPPFLHLDLKRALGQVELVGEGW